MTVNVTVAILLKIILLLNKLY